MDRYSSGLRAIARAYDADKLRAGGPMTPPPKTEPRIEYLRPASLPGLEFLSAENDHGAWHFFHERYVICAVDHASTLCRYRGKIDHVQDGHIMLMEPGEAHKSRPVYVAKPAFNFKVAFFDPILFVNAAKERGLRTIPHFPSLLVSHPPLSRAIYRLFASIAAGGEVLEQQSRMVHCIALALAHGEETAPEIRTDNKFAVRRARAHLLEHFNKPVCLDELSAVARLSPYHLVRSFTQRFGLPPHAYQIHIRIERARALLAAGISAAEIASDVGFADQSHFTRHFRRIMRTTPASYAKAVR
jgi:AraC-like DNA-binding protein